MTNTLQVGQKVKANGYEGRIIKIHTGQLTGMVDIRLDSGDICTDDFEVL